MTIECPKCRAKNPDDTAFCGKCGTKLDLDVSPTKTIETPTEELTRRSIFAGRYEIIEELGKGGMGRVYRVEDKKTKEEIALKLIKPEIATDKKTIERFRNELTTARKIRHKNVCGMFDLGEEKGLHFITMEYISGQDLKGLIKQSAPLSVVRTIMVAKQICEGLIEAHKLGIVHRDLKPSNIMIDKEGDIKIMDFGIARYLKGKGITGAGVMIGTPEYMSPEQVEAKEVDQRSDIYSLGIILYEMTTGKLPFEADTPFAVGVKQKSEEPENPKDINPQIPEDLSRVILKCLNKDKGNRYQNAGEVQSELENIEKNIPSTQREISKKKPLTSREITVTLGLRRLLIPAFVIIALVIAAVAIWQLLPQKKAVATQKIENSVAVISFENQTGDKAYDYLGKAIPSLLITNLENTGYLYVATWERMLDLLNQMGEKNVQVIDRNLGFDLCQREGIEAIVLGSFIKMGDTFATDVKVLDVDTMKLLTSASSQGEGVDSIIKTQINKLSEDISQGIGIARQKIDATQLQIAEVTTTSMEAYNHFLKGKENYDLWNHIDAQRFLEKAVELDPTFAIAYYYLALTHHRLGDNKSRDETLEKAKAFSEKASEKERLYIEAEYALTIENNREKRFRILTQMEKKYPKEKRVKHDLGVYYQSINRHKGIELFKEALELDPSYGLVINQLGYAYTGLDDYEKAIECFKKYAFLYPRDANPLDSWAEAYFKMGRLDESIAKYKEALIVNPDFYNAYWKIGYIYALKENYSQAMNWVNQDISIAPTLSTKADGGFIWKGFYYAWLGRFDEALIELKRVVDIWKKVENKGWESVTERIIAWIYFDRGELESCRKHFKKGFDAYIKNLPEAISYITLANSTYLGLAELKEGRIDSAKSRLSKMKSLLPKINNKYALFYYDILNGEVLLAEGSVDKAIAVCENTRTLGTPAITHSIRTIMYSIPFLNDALARAYLQKEELDKAIAEYQQLITFDPNSEERRLIHPKLHYRLAKLYEEKGLRGKARAEYEKFLDLWKDADPGLSEVEDARKRLAGLKGS